MITGEDRLGRYSATGPTHEHWFCATCGVRLFSRGDVEGLGPFMTVMVSTLDDAPELLREVTVTFQDGRNDNWRNPPDDVRGL